MRDGQQVKQFTTLDAYMAGFLVLRGFTPELIEQGPKVVFSFIRTDALLDALSQYNAGATVEAVRFALTIKTLKSQIFSLRRNKDDSSSRKPNISSQGSH